MTLAVDAEAYFRGRFGIRLNATLASFATGAN